MWEIEITVTNLAERRVHCSAARTDGADVRTYSLDTIVPEGITSTQAATGLANQFWALHQAALTKESAAASFLSTIASEAATNLDGKEA